YNSFMGSYVISATIMMISCKITKETPIGFSCNRDKIIAIMSIPPVEAPRYKDKPTPLALITPPETAFKIISSDNDTTGKTSRNKIAYTTERMLYNIQHFLTIHQFYINIR